MWRMTFEAVLFISVLATLVYLALLYKESRALTIAVSDVLEILTNK